MKSYAKNGRKNNKFIDNGVNIKRENKQKWMKRWIVTLRLRVVRRWKGKGGKMKRQNKERWKVILSLRVVGRWKGKGMRKVGGSAIIKKKVNVKKEL